MPTKNLQAVATKDAAINEQAKLRETLNEVGATIATRSAKPRVILNSLSDLLDMVLEQFGREECRRCRVVEEAGISKDLTRMLSTHASLVSRVVDLQEYAETTHPTDLWWVQLHEMFEAFQQAFEAHEQAEVAMLPEPDVARKTPNA